MKHAQLVSDVQRLTESLGQSPEPVVEPAFIVISGLPGTGKSYFCSKLAERSPFIILESDVLRKVLFSSPTYSQQESSRLFQAVQLLIEELLKRGTSLILDATNLSERYREHLYSITDRLEVKLVLVRVEAPPQVVYERLKARRENSAEKSDADWTVYQKMEALVQRIHRNHYAIDTSQDITPALDKIVGEINK
ncbi:AAA family ATPase [Chloroflexota bacterium]